MELSVMHRLVWSAGAQALSWTLPNGAHPLPTPVASAMGFDSIVLIDSTALLVNDNGLTPLQCGRELFTDRWRFIVQAEERQRPTVLGFERTRSDEMRVSVPSIRLVDEDNREIEVGETPLLVGRHPACGLPTVDRRVSLFHCAIVRCNGHIKVIDLGSRNGTLVDGTRISTAMINRHASIRVGRRLFEVRVIDNRPHTMVIASDRMQQLDSQLARISPSVATIMLTGESGSGKELVARRIHEMSGRQGAFVAINCAVLSTTLASSELFGHVRGSFTGAESDRPGAFAQADGGTLFLDEIAELQKSVQAEILRAVELRSVRSVGDNHERKVDVRLVVATHRHLEQMVIAGDFREDLFHRLSVIMLDVPPLRERPEDLDAIAERFLASQSPPRALTAGAWNKLRGHTWPGNIRELINTLRRACLMHDTPTLDADDIQLSAPKRAVAANIDGLIHEAVVADWEANGRSVAQTARNLGIQRRTVHRLLRDANRQVAYSRRGK
jgi:DNA-binding NtrC family response regulator